MGRSIVRPSVAIAQIKRDIIKAVQKAEKQSAATGVKIAKDLSAGGKSSAQLAEEDHPFAKRHGKPQDRADIINRQTGVFARTWRLKTAPQFGVFTRTEHFAPAPVIVNDTSYADFLKNGTRYAFARPIDHSVLALLMPVRMENLITELKKLER